MVTDGLLTKRIVTIYKRLSWGCGLKLNITKGLQFADCQDLVTVLLADQTKAAEKYQNVQSKMSWTGPCDFAVC